MTEPFPRPGGGVALIVERHGLGDAFIGLHFLRALRRLYPEEEVSVIASEGRSPYGHGMARLAMPLVDRVIEYAHIKTPLRQAIRNMRAMPRVAVAFDHRSNYRAVLLARMFYPCDIYLCALPWYWLSARRPRRRRPYHRLGRLTALLEALAGVPADGEGDGEIALAPEATAAAARLLPAGPRDVGFAPGATMTDQQRRWPLDRFVALADAVASEGASPVFLLGPAERDLLAPLRAKAPLALLPGCDVVAGRTLEDVELTIALGRRLAGAISNDCGMAHLLAAADRPLLVLFGPSDAARWRPVGAHVEILTAQQFGGHRMESIPVEAVRTAFDRLLAGATAPAAERSA
jgi:ADP-heptose:LPS heptosyltransferase